MSCYTSNSLAKLIDDQTACYNISNHDSCLLISNQRVPHLNLGQGAGYPSLKIFLVPNSIPPEKAKSLK